MQTNFLELLKVIFLGIVEGITEWLPISSTGHMLLVDEWMPLQMTEDFKEMFFVVIQLGAILAVVVLFWHKMFPFEMQSVQVREGGAGIQKRRIAFRKDVFLLWVKVAVASIPAGVAGLLLDDFLEEHFGNAFTIALMLILYGVAFLVVEWWNQRRTPKVSRLEDIGFGTALLIGAFQALSLIPGTSRSGATIVGALLIGVGRTAAAEFTFFLAVPAMVGASAYKLVKFGFAFTSGQLAALILGMVVAFVVSLLVIRFLMRYIQRHDFKAFGWYRIALGLVVLLVCALR